MKSMRIQTSDERSFFTRGRQLASLADQGKALPSEQVISFEDPADLLGLLTAARLALFRVVKEQPDSITGIAARLHRDRSAVKRDVDQLAMAGLVKVEDRVLAGHGRMKYISATASRVRLEASLG